MITIWRWNPEIDRPHVVRMGQRFIEQTTTGAFMGAAATLEQIEGVVRRLEAHGTVFKATDEHGQIVGMLGLCLFEQPYTREVQAEEMVLWVEPHARHTRAAPQLIAAGEDWARQVGAAVLKWAAPPLSGFARWLERHGYLVVEVSYAKPLTEDADARIQPRVRGQRQRARRRAPHARPRADRPGSDHEPEA